MFGGLNDKMGARRQCRLCPWRRTLHVYMLYTTYLVTTIGQCQTRSVVAPVTSSKSTYPTASSIPEEILKYRCRLSCNIPDWQQQACTTANMCSNNISCREALNCIFQCRSQYSNTTVSPNMTAVCDTDDLCTYESEQEKCSTTASQQKKPSKCDQINDQSFQFEKPDSLTWSEFFSKTEYGVSCNFENTKCSCCTTKGCCPASLILNCKLAIPTTSKTSTTTTSKATSTSTVSTSKIQTTTPTTSTTTTTPTTSTTTTTPTTSTTTTTTTMVSTSEKGTTSPGVFTSSDSTQTVTEGRSTASQTDSDPVPTIAALLSMLILSIVVIIIIVIIVLRRNRRRKPAENPEFVINNTAYGDVTLHPKTHPGPDNPKSSREVPAIPETDEEHTYCYASFDDSKQTVNTESQHPNVQDPINATTSPDGSYFVLDKSSQKHGDNYKMEQAIVMEHLVEQQTGHMKNKLDNPSNNFVLDKPKSIYDTQRQETDESANYFVLETTSDEHEPGVKRNHEEEITETGDTRSGKADDNYFLVDKSDVGPTADDRETSNVSSNYSTFEKQDHTSNDNYIVLDKITDDSKVVKHMETHCGNRLQNSDNTETCAKPRANGTPTTTDDPYDHVRIGHAHTNGFDDGVYDELRKQHVRYEAEEVENDYDHC